jgi:hypothetical protein
MIPEASPVLAGSFVALAMLVAPALPLGVYRGVLRCDTNPAAARRLGLLSMAGVALWMAITSAAAASGWLEFGPFPPPIAFLLIPMFIGVVALARSSIGQRLATGIPLAALVGIHAFRLPLELIMHRAYSEGVMPVQMSYSGFNFDILTGIGAIVVATLLLLGRMPIRGVKIWNWGGSLLLLNIVVIALLSTPTPLRVFPQEPANVWIVDAPFIWLPSLFVAYALLGHLLVFRRLRSYSAAGTLSADSMREAGRTQ